MRIKAYVFLVINHHAMGGVAVKIHILLTSAVGGNE